MTATAAVTVTATAAVTVTATATVTVTATAAVTVTATATATATGSGTYAYAATTGDSADDSSRCSGSDAACGPIPGTGDAIHAVMPAAQEILDGLATTANDWLAVAIAWHILLLIALAALVRRWRPSYRTVIALLAALPFSVAVFAFAAGNPFNTIVFVVLATTMMFLARRESRQAVRRARWTWLGGVVVIAYGWIYPHFLAGDAWLYVVGAPVGIVPCPTLAVVAGCVLLGSDGVTRATRWTLAAFAAFYAIFGVVRLGVLLDVGLFAAAVMLAISALEPRRTLFARTPHDAHGLRDRRLLPS